VIPGRVYFRIHVGAGGLFGAFAHDHHIKPIQLAGGTIKVKDELESAFQLFLK